MLPRCISAAELAELAARRAVLSGSLPLDGLERLRDLLAGPSARGANVQVRLEFRPAGDGRPVLHLGVEGEIWLVCQRCLGPVRWPLELEADLTVLAAESEAESLTEPFDSVVIGEAGLVTAEVVEDEILAAMPMVPSHAPGTECGVDVAQGATEAERHRPFADLRSLLGMPETGKE